MNEEEIAQIYSKKYSLLRGFALKLTNNLDDAEDLVQDTILKLYLNKGKFVNEKSLMSWIFKVIKNSFLDSCKLKSNRVTKFELNESIYQTDNFKYYTNSGFNSLIEEDINNIINKSNINYVNCFNLYVDGFTMEDISDELKIPIGTVKNRIHKFKKELKNSLSDYSYLK